MGAEKCKPRLKQMRKSNLNCLPWKWIWMFNLENELITLLIERISSGNWRWFELQKLLWGQIRRKYLDLSRYAPFHDNWIFQRTRQKQTWGAINFWQTREMLRHKMKTRWWYLYSDLHVLQAKLLCLLDAGSSFARCQRFPFLSWK